MLKLTIMPKILLAVFLVAVAYPALALSPLPWYNQTDGPFFIVEITSIEPADGRPEFNYCKAVLSFLGSADITGYSDRKNFYIEKRYSEDLTVGDMLLTELRLFGPDSFRVKEIRGNLQILPIKDNKLIFTEQYANGGVFNGITSYIKFRKSENILFYDGMSIDEIKIFFKELSRYRKEYVERLHKNAPGQRPSRK